MSRPPGHASKLQSGTENKEVIAHQSQTGMPVITLSGEHRSKMVLSDLFWGDSCSPTFSHFSSAQVPTLWKNKFGTIQLELKS